MVLISFSQAFERFSISLIARLTLKLRDEDEILINEISKVNDNIVVVYVGGSAIDMSMSLILLRWFIAFS